MARVTAALVLVAGVMACGDPGSRGGSGGGEDPPIFPVYPAAAADSMLQPFVTGAGELLLIDPAAPDGVPLVVDSGLPPPTRFGDPDRPLPSAQLKLLPAGTFDPVQNAIADQHHRFAWYQKGGVIYRVDLLNTSSHSPVQVSSVTDACAVGGEAVDYGDPLGSLLMILGAGDDGECYTADDRGHLVAFGAASDDPGTAAPPELEILDWISAPDGSVQRLIVSLHRRAASRAIASYAPDLSSSKDLVPLDAFTWISGGPDSSRTQQYFVIEPAGGAQTLYRYDADADAMAPLYVFSQGGHHPLRADGEHLYFWGNDSLYRIGHAATEPEPLEGAGPDFFLTANRIAYLASRAGGVSLESIPKAGASTYTVLEPPGGLRVVAVVGTRVYYDKREGTSWGSARSINEDGTGASAVADSFWLGKQRSPDDTAGGLEPWPRARTMLLGTTDASGALTVRGIDADTAIAGPVLGAIADSAWATVSGVGRYARLNAFVGRDGGAADFDAYFADIQNAGSLRAAATTPGLNDVTPLPDTFVP